MENDTCQNQNVFKRVILTFSFKQMKQSILIMSKHPNSTFLEQKVMIFHFKTLVKQKFTFLILKSCV